MLLFLFVIFLHTGTTWYTNLFLWFLDVFALGKVVECQYFYCSSREEDMISTSQALKLNILC